jgi:hypothetical protein
MLTVSDYKSVVEMTMSLAGSIDDAVAVRSSFLARMQRKFQV